MSRGFIPVFLVAVLVLWCASARPAAAAWPPEGVPLCGVGACDADFVRMCTDTEGGAYVVWGDSRYGNLDIFAQRVTAAGEIAAGWPENGVPVCANPSTQGRTLWSVAPDGLGGAIVDWYDLRNAGTTGIDIYAQRVLADGGIAPGWPVDGAPVTQLPGQQAWPIVIADGVGGAYFSWDDDGNPDLYLQHLTAMGVPAPGWSVNGLPICTLPNYQGSPRLVSDGVGGALLSWGDLRDGPSAVYVQRVLPDGSLALGWPANGVRLAANRNIRGMISDGAGGGYVACSTPGPVQDGDYYLQKFTGAGAIPAGWPEDGVLVCTAPDERGGIRMALDAAGGALLSWTDYRFGGSEAFAHRMQPDGTRALGWPANGLRVTNNAPGDFDPDPASDAMGGLYLAWTRYAGGLQNVALQHIGANGTPFIGWPANGLDLPADATSYLPSIIADGVGGAIVAWERSDGTVRALRLAANGPVSVQLALVSAEANGDRVRLLWHSAEASLALRLERRTEASDWTVLASLSPDGSGRIEYEDRDVVAGARYGYRLAYLDDGVERVTAEAWVTMPRLELALGGFQPNPAVGIPAVAFVLGESAPTTLEVYDVAGRRVANHAVGGLGPGAHTLPLDAGVRLAPGIYALRLVQGDRVLKARGVVMR